MRCETRKRRFWGGFLTFCSLQTYPLRYHLENLESVLSVSPLSKWQTREWRWIHILGVFWSLIIEIPGGGRLFYRLQDDFWCLGIILMTPVVHAELNIWFCLVLSLQSYPTHMLEVMPPDLICFRASNASAVGMGGVFLIPHALSPHLALKSPAEISLQRF